MTPTALLELWSGLTFTEEGPSLINSYRLEPFVFTVATSFKNVGVLLLVLKVPPAVHLRNPQQKYEPGTFYANTQRSFLFLSVIVILVF